MQRVQSGEQRATMDAGIGSQPTPEELQACQRVLQWLATNPTEADSRDELGQSVARAYKRVRKERRRIAIENAPKPAPQVRSTPEPFNCYVCQTPFSEAVIPYPRLCRACAIENLERRTRRADLSGRRALVTGGRVKVGYQTALKLLRDGAEVIITTRFPKDAARRYALEDDFAQWRDHLSLYAMDFRDLSRVQAFVTYLCRSLSHLDILINNAAQTIRRPRAAYRELLALEAAPANALPNGARELLSSTRPWSATDMALPPSVVPSLESLGPVLDADHTPVTRSQRPSSSWLMSLRDVHPIELVEVMAINAIAPFMLCGLLEPLLQRSPHSDRYIVNVSSAEGQFSPLSKMHEHPHTNMAKAALNMLTRTSAEKLAGHGIYMNSVDPGWITHMSSIDPRQPEDSHHERSLIEDPPLDEIDGAARIYDPIIRGTGGNPVYGELLRNYAPVSW